MKRSSWHRIEAAFFAVLAKPAEERGASLEHHCAGDASLLAEVRSLLAAHDADRAFLEQAYAGLPAPPETSDREEPTYHERVGAFRIIRPVARGGMGEVFLAARADDFRQHVALKIIRRGLDTDDVLRRFAAERQILASLSHPNIASLVDGGATPDGRSFFAMEFVDGRPITAYADSRRLTVNERLGLLLTVCAAVHHAHQRLIVHRDIKPSNVLVDVEGHVKLLDFGIAKILQPALQGDGGTPVASARTESPVLTPEYASPEQRVGGTITVATDVYGLGALAHELVTGLRPDFKDDAHRAERPPVRPSIALRRAADREALAESRQMSFDRLSRRLSGDLGLILLKALHPDPEQRYPSVAALADDIERYIANRTVQARQTSLAYRTRKFVGRHPAGVGMTAAVVILLIAFSITTAIQSAQIRAHAEIVSRERDTAQHLSDFLIGLFRAGTPDEAQGANLSARDVLDRGRLRIDSHLAGQPDVQARLLTAVGEAYAALGLYEQALELERRAVALMIEIRGAHSLEAAESMTALGTTLRRTGSYTEAEALHRHALAVRRERLGPDHVDVAASLNNLAVVLRILERNDEAEAAYRESLAIRTAALGANHVDLAAPLSNIAALMRGAGRYDEALVAYQQSLAILRGARGSDHPDVASTLSRLGLLLKEIGEYAAAEPYLREALDIRRRVLPAEHPDLAHTLGSLGLLLKDLGHLDEAERFLHEAVAVSRSALGEDHPTLAVHLHNLARLLHDLRRLDEAEVHLRRALDITSRSLGDEHRDVALMHQSLGWLLLDLGRLDHAEPHLQTALAIRRNVLGDEHHEVAQSLSTLGLLHRSREDLALASSLYGEAHAVYRAALGERHAYTAAAMYNVAIVHLERDEIGDARRLFEGALTIYESALPPGHDRTAQARVGLGRTYMAAGQVTRAEPVLRRALDDLQTSAGDHDPRTAEARAALGICLARLGRRAEATVLLAAALPELAAATASRPLARQADAVYQEITGTAPGRTVDQ